MECDAVEIRDGLVNVDWSSTVVMVSNVEDSYIQRRQYSPGETFCEHRLDQHILIV